MIIYTKGFVMKKIPVGMCCDYCKRGIVKQQAHDNELSWHHTAWGNDSGDSYEYRDICNRPECYKAFLKEALTTLKDNKLFAVINEMNYVLASRLHTAIVIQEKRKRSKKSMPK